jgi:hypothetical protein
MAMPQPQRFYSARTWSSWRFYFLEDEAVIAMDRVPRTQLRASRFARLEILQGKHLRHTREKKEGGLAALS